MRWLIGLWAAMVWLLSGYLIEAANAVVEAIISLLFLSPVLATIVLLFLLIGC